MLAVKVHSSVSQPTSHCQYDVVIFYTFTGSTNLEGRIGDSLYITTAINYTNG